MCQFELAPIRGVHQEPPLWGYDSRCWQIGTKFVGIGLNE